MKINDKSQTYIVLAAIIFAVYYFIYKPTVSGISETLGIKDSPEKKAVSKETTNAKSPFSTTFWRNYTYQKPAPANGRKLVPDALAASMPKLLKDIKKCFGVVADDEPAALAFFGRFKTQCELSFFSAYFSEKYGKDLLSFISEGLDVLPQNGLSDTEVNTIIKAIKLLPLR